MVSALNLMHVVHNIMYALCFHIQPQYVVMVPYACLVATVMAMA